MDTDTAGFNGIAYELVGGDVSFFLVDGKGDITSSRVRIQSSVNIICIIPRAYKRRGHATHY